MSYGLEVSKLEVLHTLKGKGSHKSVDDLSSD